MRRALCLLMFLIGAILVGVQVMVAFFAGTFGDLGSLAYFTAITMPFLVLGAWLSPGDRPREVAITLLSGATTCVASFSLVRFVPDETGGMLRLEKVPPSAFTIGFVNLAIIYVGSLLMLFRRQLGVTR